MIDCGFPGYLVNGYVLGTSHLYGDIVRYTCRPGYRLYGGDATQRCGRNRLWSGRRPTCKGNNILLDQTTEKNWRDKNSSARKISAYSPCSHSIGIAFNITAITCRLSDPFPNGRVLNRRASYGIGQTIRLDCQDSNFTMDGPNHLVCLDDGTWNDMLPTCKFTLSCNILPM